MNVPSTVYIINWINHYHQVKSYYSFNRMKINLMKLIYFYGQTYVFSMKITCSVICDGMEYINPMFILILMNTQKYIMFWKQKIQ